MMIFIPGSDIILGEKVMQRNSPENDIEDLQRIEESEKLISPKGLRIVQIILRVITIGMEYAYGSLTALFLSMTKNKKSFFISV
jgi:hypothetical protein